MLDLQHVTSCLCPIGAFTTTLLSGTMLIYCMLTLDLLHSHTYMSCRLCNPQELFNLHYAMLRNVIEWIFGVIKKQFHIIQLPPEYSSEIQSCIPPALCLVHNIIWIHDPDDLLDYCHVDSDKWSTFWWTSNWSSAYLLWKTTLVRVIETIP
jgi:hypothetical protein